MINIDLKEHQLKTDVFFYLQTSPSLIYKCSLSRILPFPNNLYDLHTYCHSATGLQWERKQDVLLQCPAKQRIVIKARNEDSRENYD